MFYCALRSEVRMSSKKESIRWIDLSDEQKRQIIRMRNAESARRSRQRRKNQNDQIEQEYEKNERKIVELEKMVEDLSSRLGKDRPSSSTAPSNTTPSSSTMSTRLKPKHKSAKQSKRLSVPVNPSVKSKHQRQPGNSSKKDDPSRPTWFGDPF